MSPPRDSQSNGAPVEESQSALRHLRTMLSAPPAARRARAGSTGSIPARPAPIAGRGVVTADDVLALVDAPAPDREDERQRPSRTAAPVLPAAVPLPGTIARSPGDLPAVASPSQLRARRLQRRNGVAPFVRPSARRSKRKRRRDYRKLGFIELTQDRVKLRHRILPRTVLGISTMLLALGVGAAFAGASLYAFYDYRLTQNEARIGDVLKGFDKEFGAAVQEIQKLRDDSVNSINQSLQPLQSSIDDVNATVELRGKVGKGTLLVRTTDTAGRVSIGAAFVVSSTDNETLLLTALEVVSAATATPGPAVTVEKNSEQFPATVVSWDDGRDLALLKIARGGFPSLPWASEATRAAAASKRVYVVSGLGGGGSTVSAGQAIDQSQVGLRHDASIAADFRGGPIVTSSGEVLAIATTTYRPLGFDGAGLPFAPTVVHACEKVLICPPAVLSGAASPGQQPPAEPPTRTAPPATPTPTTAKR